MLTTEDTMSPFKKLCLCLLASNTLVSMAASSDSHTQSHHSDGNLVQRVERILVRESFPEYPMRAMARELTGWVELELIVDKKGNVVEASVVNNCARKGRGPCSKSPNRVFDKAALVASTGLQFKSGQRETITHRMIFDLAL
ncbi:MAG: TonB family protein [Pseudomonadota bacterium]